MKNQMKSKKQVQFILHLAVLFSALIFTTGCFKKKEGINIPLSAKNVRGARNTHTANNQHQNHPNNNGHYNNNNPSDNGWLAVQPAYQAGRMEEVLVAFLDSDDVGFFEDIEIRLYNEELDIRIWDDLGDWTLSLRKERMLCHAAPCPQAYTAYTDGQGYVTLEEFQAIDNDISLFRIDFDNTFNGNGEAGTLGYVELYLCEVDGTC